MGQRRGVKPARSMTGWDAVTRKASVNVLWRSGLRAREDFHNLVSMTKPKKWKIFQMLLIKNENDQVRAWGTVIGSCFPHGSLGTHPLCHGCACAK